MKVSTATKKAADSSDSEMNDILKMMSKLLHWAAIIESSDDAVISKSLDGIITSWNNGAEKLYGYTPDEIVGKPVSVLMPPEKEDDFTMIMDRLLAGKKVDHYETKRLTKTGEVIDVSLTVSPIKDSRGNIIGASKIARDITDRKESERRRAEFISAVSHELKTPTTSQKMYGELLEQLIKENGDTQYETYIKKMNQQTEKLIMFINDLLEHSRGERNGYLIKKRRFSIDELINETVEEVELISKHKFIRKTTAKKQVWGDRERISQVITNLLSNASKYSPDSEKIVVTSEVNDEVVQVSVQDFGIGIPKKHQKRIFEQFFRITDEESRTYPGMGIGLNICQKIVNRHGGKLWVESEPKKGSTFYFSLPLYKNAKKSK